MKRALWILLFCLGAAPAASADAVGMVFAITGKPEFRPGNKGAWRPLPLLQRFEAGDAVRCGAGAEASIVLFGSGGRFQVGAGQDAVVGAAGIPGARALAALAGPSAQVARTLAGGRVGAVLARPGESHQRLTPQFSGWLPEGERRFEWNPEPGAASYTFSLFGPRAQVLWSQRGTEAHAVYPTELPALETRKPYVWQLVCFSSNGKMKATRWGLLTFLSQEDAGALQREAPELLKQAEQTPEDRSPLLLLAELYRQYGVLMKTLETLEDVRLSDVPGLQSAKDEAYHQAGLAALMFARRPIPETGADEESPAP